HGAGPTGRAAGIFGGGTGRRLDLSLQQRGDVWSDVPGVARGGLAAELLGLGGALRRFDRGAHAGNALCGNLSNSDDGAVYSGDDCGSRDFWHWPREKCGLADATQAGGFLTANGLVSLEHFPSKGSKSAPAGGKLQTSVDFSRVFD